MKKLSEFKGREAIIVAARVMQALSRILADEKNRNAKGSVLGLFVQFSENSPEEMGEIFAILSGKDPATYVCDGAEAFENLKTLANDPAIAGLFLSQHRTGDATSSGAASASTKD